MDLPVYVFEPNWGGLLSLVITLLLPLAVGLVTTRVTSSGVKAVILLALATVKTVVEALIAANGAETFNVIPVLMNAAINFGVAVAVHFGFWKPTGTAAAAERTGVTAP